jgi:hypothetical protein
LRDGGSTKATSDDLGMRSPPRNAGNWKMMEETDY